MAIDGVTIISTVCVAGVIALAIKLYYGRKHRGSTIPGPRPWPIIGNVHILDNVHPQKAFTRLTQQYGDVYQLHVFNERMVIVSGPESIREVLVTKSGAFAGRFLKWRSSLIKGKNQKGINMIATSMSQKWNFVKHTAMSSLKMVGGGVEMFENIAEEIFDETLQDILKLNSTLFDPHKLIHKTVSNINALLIFGKRYGEQDEEELIELDRGFNTLAANNRYGMMLDTFPPMRWIPTEFLGELKLHTARIREWMKTHIEDTVKRYHNDGISCAISDFIKEMESDSPELDMDDLIMITADLVIAGNITTSNAITALFAILAEHQELQEELYQKIHEAIGDRRPKVADKAALPFVESLIWELLRYISHVSLGVPHRTMTDIELQGHIVPKDTKVITNLWALHHDPKLWEEPWTFKADRFLDEQGKLVTADHRFRRQMFPFGAGRRVCAGEMLARNRLFLLITSFIQKFTIYPGEGTPEAADPNTYRTAMVLYPGPFTVKMVPR